MRPKYITFKNILILSLLLTSANISLCSCGSSVVSEQGTTSGKELETTTADEQDMTQTDPSMENLLGCTNWHIERKTTAPDFYSWIFINDDTNEIFAEYFGFKQYKPDAFYVDIDSDGEKEIICNCQYGGDMANRALIYRNNKGIIEVGELNIDKVKEKYNIDLSGGEITYDVIYSESDKSIVLYFTETNKQYIIDYDMYEYSTYKYVE